MKAASADPPVAPPARRRQTLVALARRPAAVGAAAVLLALVAFVVLFPLVSAHDPNDVDFAKTRQGPSLEHPLGTDQFGRDLLARVAVGGRTTLAIAVAALTIILALGFVWGATAALAGGWVDSLLMRVVDGLFAIPRLPIAIVLLVVLSFRAQSVAAIVAALSIAGWMLTARLVRGHVLSLKTRDFVVAARATGATRRRIVRRHILPNSSGVLLVAALLELPTVVVGEALLSVLGLGPPPPTATWGNIAYDGWQFARLWEMLVATVAIVLFAGAANVLADAVGDVLDPRRRGTRTLGAGRLSQ
ncbi:MAG: ABC transporter permease [Thermoleophilia bacterium]|nr:ABC transporter permease [Thermoleophilia bacterium]